MKREGEKGQDVYGYCVGERLAVLPIADRIVPHRNLEILVAAEAFVVAAHSSI